MRTADDGKLMRTLLQTILQALVDAEATEHIGAGMHQQNDTRTTHARSLELLNMMSRLTSTWSR